MDEPRPAQRDPLRLMLGIGALMAGAALLIGAIAALRWTFADATPAAPLTGPVAAQPAAPSPTPQADLPTGGNRFTLRLGQGFRFKDRAVVVQKQDEHDLIFRYLPPQLGGTSLRFNPLTKQMEMQVEAKVDSFVPVIDGYRVKAFDERPDVARLTTGEVAAFGGDAFIGPATRHLVVQTRAGEHYLLTLDQLDSSGNPNDGTWRAGWTFERVDLPVGTASGQVNKPLPGRLIYRDWFRSKMIVSVDLMTGKETRLFDGQLPSAVAGRVAYVDSTGAIVVADEAGKAVATLRLSETIDGVIALSPDGQRLLTTINRRDKPTKENFGIVGDRHHVVVLDLEGKELAAFPDVDDAAWTPDGRIVATGNLLDAGLFLLNPGTKEKTTVHESVPYATRPTVSPNGKTVAFVSGGKVWTCGLDGSTLKQAFPDGHGQQRPTFSPDGSKLLFVVNDMAMTQDTGSLYVLDLATNELTQLRTSTGETLTPDVATGISWVK